MCYTFFPLSTASVNICILTKFGVVDTLLLVFVNQLSKQTKIAKDKQKIITDDYYDYVAMLREKEREREREREIYYSDLKC